MTRAQPFRPNIDQQAASFRHEAMFYEGEEGFLAGAVPFVREGLDGGEPVLVAVGRPRLDSLERALGARSAALTFADMAMVGRNPARIISVWQRFADAAAARGRPFRGIGEPISVGRSADELVECHRHESLLNAAFSGSDPWWLLCPYDVSSLPDEVIDEARQHHPLVFDGQRHAPSAAYKSDFDVFAGVLPEPLSPPTEAEIDEGSLGRVRAVALATATAAGLGWERASDFTLAVHEMAANCLQHGGGRGRLLAWHEGGVALCEARGSGRIEGPLVGRIEPAVAAERGRGLWLVNQLCDLVQIRSSGEGSVVRIRLGAS